MRSRLPWVVHPLTAWPLCRVGQAKVQERWAVGWWCHAGDVQVEACGAVRRPRPAPVPGVPGPPHCTRHHRQKRPRL
jgi:hypothetical protein